MSTYLTEQNIPLGSYFNLFVRNQQNKSRIVKVKLATLIVVNLINATTKDGSTNEHSH